LSNCCLRSGDFDAAIHNCTRAIEVDANAVKALFYRSQAHQKAKSFDESLKDIVAAVKLDPQNKSLREHWASVKADK